MESTVALGRHALRPLVTFPPVHKLQSVLVCRNVNFTVLVVSLVVTDPSALWRLAGFQSVTTRQCALTLSPVKLLALLTELADTDLSAPQ